MDSLIESYIKEGWKLVPANRRSKVPLMSWIDYIKVPPSAEKMYAWFKEDYNIALLTGANSGVVVVDIDEPDMLGTVLAMADTGYISKTGSGGYHLFYKYRQGIRNAVSALDGVDVRSDGGIIILPGSIHENGNRYEWVKRESIGSISDELFEAITAKRTADKVPGTDQKWLSELIGGVEKGGRNDSLSKLAGYLFSKALPFDVVLGMCKMWNANNQPPLGEEELNTTVTSVYRYHVNKGQTILEPTESQSVSSGVMGVVPLNTFMLEYGAGEVKWLIDEWLPEESITFFVAPPGSYKTWLLLDLMVSIASGYPFLNHLPIKKAGPVILIQQEDSNIGLAERIGVIYNSKFRLIEGGEVSRMAPDLPIYIHPYRQLRFDNPESVKGLIKLVDTIRPKLVLIDPLYSTANTDNYLTKAAEQMLVLKHLRDKYGCGFVIAHHTTKHAEKGTSRREDVWGSQFLNAFLETGWQIRTTDEPNVITVRRHTKMTGVLPVVRLEFDIKTPFHYTVNIGEHVKQPGEDKVLDLLKSAPRTTKELSDEIGQHRTTIGRKLKQLEKDGLVKRNEDGTYEPV